jgi:2'-5' RNA ligase
LVVETPMLLSEVVFFEDAEGPTGAYIACSFSKESQDALYKFAEDCNLPSIVPRDKFHITVIYSKKPVPQSFKAKGDFRKPLLVEFKKLTVFATREGNGALVMELYAPELAQRHNYLMKKYSLKYDFPEYKAHVTLCYDVGAEFEIPKVKPSLELEVVNEYYETLNKDWAKSNT